jgi:hypothetical protein
MISTDAEFKLPELVNTLALIILLAMPIAGFASQSDDSSRLAPDPQSVDHHVHVRDKLLLQKLLNRSGVLILDPDTDYRTGGLSHLIMSSGQKIVGGWNTRVPQILVPGGVSKVTIDSVYGTGYPSADILFSGGGGTNDDCVVIGGSSSAGNNTFLGFARGAMVNRLRVSYFGGAMADLSLGGYIRDSTFVAGALYNVGPPLMFKGNEETRSYGNAFLGIASTTNHYSNIWEDFGDLWAVGLDCESWNQTALPGEKACFVFRNLSSVRGTGPTGGTAYPGSGPIAEYDNVHSVALVWPIGHGGKNDVSDFHFDHVDTTVLVHAASDVRYVYTHDPGDALRIELLYPFGGDPITDNFLNGVPLRGQLKATSARRLMDALGEMQTQQAAARPRLRRIDDLLGPNWREGLASRPDSSAVIQRLIDRDHIAKLATGVYYLSRPLKVGSAQAREGIVGHDKDKVYLVAKGDFPIVEGRGDFREPIQRSPLGVNVVFEGLTFFGGTYGILFSDAPGNIGSYAQINWSRFANLKFMRQMHAAVRAEHIYGIDNNFWYKVDFIDTVDGVSGEGAGFDAGMTYADKQYFVNCQFERLLGAAWAWNAERASGGNPIIDSYFLNVGSISNTRSAYNNIWVNDVFENIRGPYGIRLSDSGGTTATYILAQVNCLWKGVAPDIITGTGSSLLGTLFINTEFAEKGGQITSSIGRNALLSWGSRITDTARMGAPVDALLINSLIGPETASSLLLINHSESALHVP